MSGLMSGISITTILMAASATETITITVTEIPTYLPPAPVNLNSTRGSSWVNYTWEPGAGNVTDSYNVNVNGTWTNGTSNNYINTSIGPHGWSNISVYAYNASGSGTLSLNPVSGETQVLNTAPVQTPIGDKAVTAGMELTFSIISTDADSDPLTYGTNATEAYLMLQPEPIPGQQMVLTLELTCGTSIAAIIMAAQRPKQ